MEKSFKLTAAPRSLQTGCAERAVTMTLPGFQVAMHDPLLVGLLQGLSYLYP